MASADLTLRKPLERAVLEVSLHITKEFRFRLWLGKILMVWAAKALGTTIEFKPGTPAITQTELFDALVKVDGVVADLNADKIRETLRRNDTMQGPRGGPLRTGQSYVIGVNGPESVVPISLIPGMTCEGCVVYGQMKCRECIGERIKGMTIHRPGV